MIAILQLISADASLLGWIQQMERQVAESDFLAQLSGHLNLGDLRMKRSENAIARAEYGKALEIASNERLTARRESDLREYALATSYAGLAQAKLGNAADAFALSEESLRYASDSPERWNTYANTMTELDKPERLSARRGMPWRSLRRATTSSISRSINTTGLFADRVESEHGSRKAAERDCVATLRSDAFSALRHSIEQSESFEIIRPRAASSRLYITVLNRSQLRPASCMRIAARSNARRAIPHSWRRATADCARGDGATRLPLISTPRPSTRIPFAL